MIWQGLLGVVFAVLCGALSYGMFKQTREWNRIVGKVEWDQTIAGYFLSAWCGVVALGLFVFALMCFYSAGYNA